MRFALIGRNGQLSQALQSIRPESLVLGSDELDITDREKVLAFDWSEIDAIVNCAAYTNVDGAETEEGRKLAWSVNAEGVRNLADAADKNGKHFLTVSTDYVFDGNSKSSYKETDPISPLNVYGASKAAGEMAIRPGQYIVRTSWVIGSGSNFARTMLKLGRDRDEVSVVNDQLGRPTFTTDLALGIESVLVNSAPPDIYHFSNTGAPVTWYDLAKEVFKKSDISCEVNSVTTAEFARGRDPFAPRPGNSTLNLSRFINNAFTPRSWSKALGEYLESL